MLKPNFKNIKREYKKAKKRIYPCEKDNYELGETFCYFTLGATMTILPLAVIYAIGVAYGDVAFFIALALWIVGPELFMFIFQRGLPFLVWRICDNKDFKERMKEDAKLIHAMLRIYDNETISEEDEIILNDHLYDMLVQGMMANVCKNGKTFYSLIESGKISGKTDFEIRFANAIKRARKKQKYVDHACECRDCKGQSGFFREYCLVCGHFLRANYR